jgi:hypothetical protein
MRGKVKGPFVSAAEEYVGTGWMPLPVLFGSKAPAVAGYHGRNPYASPALVRKWIRTWHDANVAIRLPKYIIGIDVDHYGSKRGGDTLIELERELGKLPPTYLLTSRNAPSGIRLYRVPEDINWKAHAGDSIDVISWYERYAIAAPSVHSGSGREYKWYRERKSDTGLQRVQTGIPSVTRIPDLPESWVEYLTVGDREDKKDVSTARARDWVKAHDGEMCEAMVATLASWSGEIPGGAHDAMVAGQKALCGDAADGHTGLKTALFEFRAAFDSELKSERSAYRVQDGEWGRGLRGAVGIAMTRNQVHTDICEQAVMMAGMKPQRKSGIVTVDNVPSEKLKWLHWPILPAASLVIIDGDPSQGKSLLTLTIAAAASNGKAMLPWGESKLTGPIKTLLIGTEDAPGLAIKPRLIEAGANTGEISIPRPWTDKNGEQRIITLPDNAARVRGLIEESGASLCVIDPIAAFLGEGINTNNDASVRRALTPLSVIAQGTGCCIIIIRHNNKGGTDQKAMFRGGGSIAFSAIARSGLITGKLPDELGGQFGIAHVQCNYAPVFKGTQAYSILGAGEDSDSVPYIEWGELHEDISADDLIAAPKKATGPAPDVQDEIMLVLETYFEKRSTYTKREIDEILRNTLGRLPAATTIRKAMDKMGVSASAQRGENGLITGWVWVARFDKICPF